VETPLIENLVKNPIKNHPIKNLVENLIKNLLNLVENHINMSRFGARGIRILLLESYHR
jgi:hypothetical protein